MFYVEKHNVNKLLKKRRGAILRLAKKYGASNIRVFGSFARGEEKKNSDIDLLIHLEKGRSLLDHVALWQDLEELLHRKVDVVHENALHWTFREQVLKEAVPL